jgi:hypothetical protein
MTSIGIRQASHRKIRLANDSDARRGGSGHTRPGNVVIRGQSDATALTLRQESNVLCVVVHNNKNDSAWMDA